MIVLKVFIALFPVLLPLLMTPAVGQNQTYPFAPDAIQDDGDGDGFSTCDDPVLLVKVECPVGWELDEDEGYLSFGNSSDLLTNIAIRKQNIFPIENTADYMRDILDSEREYDLDIINMSETTINGMQAHRVEYTTTAFKTIQYFIVDPEEYTGYIIELSASPGDFDKHIPTFERVANSFEITDTKTEGTKPTEEIPVESPEEPPREISPDTPLFG